MSNPYAAPTTSDVNDDLPQIIAPNVRTLQIITAALAQGAIVFAVIVLVLSGIDVASPPTTFGYVGIGIAVLVMILHFVVPPLVANSQLAGLRDEAFGEQTLSVKAGRIFAALQTSHIIACALLEGGAFLNLVVYLIDSWIGNLATAGLLIAGILMRFPTKTNMAFKIQNRLAELEF